jgi:hypothetical protein
VSADTDMTLCHPDRLCAARPPKGAESAVLATLAALVPVICCDVVTCDNWDICAGTPVPVVTALISSVGSGVSTLVSALILAAALACKNVCLCDGVIAFHSEGGMYVLLVLVASSAPVPRPSRPLPVRPPRPCPP